MKRFPATGGAAATSGLLNKDVLDMHAAATAVGWYKRVLFLCAHQRFQRSRPTIAMTTTEKPRSSFSVPMLNGAASADFSVL